MKSAYILLILSGIFSLVACSGGNDDPKPEPEREGFFMHLDPINSGTIGGEPGFPGTVTLPPEPAKITGITVYTKSKKFGADLNVSSGKDMFIIIPKEGEEPKFKLTNASLGTTSFEGIDGFGFVKNGKDTTFIKLSSEATMMMFAVEKDTYDALRPAIVQKKNGKIVPNSGGITATLKQY